MGARIQDMRLGGEPLQADKRYTVAGWAPVAEGAKGEPVWEVVETWLKSKGTIAARTPEQPRLIGVQGNPGLMPT